MKQTNTNITRVVLMSIDLIIFSALAVAFEVINNNFIEKKGIIFYLSFSMTLSIIMMIRWGVVGSVVYVIAGIAMMCVRATSFNIEVLYYVIANAFIAIPMLIYGRRDRETIVESSFNFLGFILASYFFTCVGKGIALFIIKDSVSGVLDYIGTSALTLFVNILACFILRMRKELLCDMRNCFEEKGGDYERED